VVIELISKTVYNKRKQVEQEEMITYYLKIAI